MSEDDERALLAYIAFVLRYCRLPNSKRIADEYNELRLPVIDWMKRTLEQEHADANITR